MRAGVGEEEHDFNLVARRGCGRINRQIMLAGFELRGGMNQTGERRKRCCGKKLASSKQFENSFHILGKKSAGKGVGRLAEELFLFSYDGFMALIGKAFERFLRGSAVVKRTNANAPECACLRDLGADAHHG